MRPTDAQAQPTLSVRQGENLGVTGTTVNSWLNPHTCGYGPKVDDPPFTCYTPLTCSTNADYIVGCASDTSTAFPTTCVDRSHTTISEINASLWKRGYAAMCIEDAAPACATLFFPGHPPALQFRCQATATVITMLTAPYHVVYTATSTGHGSLSTETTPPPSTAESTFAPLHTSKISSPTTTTKPDLANGIHTDTGAVAGGVVGGIALLLLLPLFWYLFRKNYPKKKKSAGGKHNGGVGGGAGGPYGDQDPEYYYPKYKKPPLIGDSAKNPPLSRDSARHIPIELTGYSPRSYGARGSDSGLADVHQQEREGFGLGSMYADGNGEFQPAGSMTTVTEESAGGSSGQGQSSAMGQAGSGGGLGAEKGKAKAEDGNFNNRAARVSDASSQYSQDGMAWKR